MRRLLGGMKRRKRLLDEVRPIALAGMAAALSLTLLWLNFLWLDEFASRFGLSEKVIELHRLVTVILAIQWLIMLTLIWGLERALSRRRSTAEAEPIGPGDGRQAE
jgi:hypothetical protein